MDDYTNNMPIVVEDEPIFDISTSGMNPIEMAKYAEELFESQKKLIALAIKSTSKKDWVRIGDSLYLQESGATKVANLFNISWKINEGYPQIVTDKDGYKTFKYRITMWRNGSSIEAEGSRSGADDFFAGKKDKETGKHSKSPDEVNNLHVERAALTSALNNGIKRIIPGLRNIDETELKEKYGINLDEVSGYTFKTGSQGGKDTRKASESGIICEHCGKAITQKVASYAQSKFGYKLCMDCQKIPNIKGVMDEEFSKSPVPEQSQIPTQKPQTRTAPTQKPPVNLDESRAVPIPDDYPSADELEYPDFLQ